MGSLEKGLEFLWGGGSWEHCLQGCVRGCRVGQAAIGAWKRGQVVTSYHSMFFFPGRGGGGGAVVCYYCRLSVHTCV